VIDVQEHAVGALEEQLLAGLHRLPEEQRRIANERADAIRIPQVFVGDRLGIHRLCITVAGGEQLVLECRDLLDLHELPAHVRQRRN
jgi:hypothetical protein